MLQFKNKKTNRIILLAILTVSFLFSVGFTNFLNFPCGMNSVDDDNEIEPIEDDLTLKSAAYSGYYDGYSQDINTTLHQSKIEVGAPLFDITNVSDPAIRTFTTNTPFEKNFNSTVSQINIDNIYAPDKYLILQENNPQDFSVGDFSTVIPRVTSFEVEGDGYINNISVFIEEQLATGRIRVVLYNATYDSGLGTYKPGGGINDFQQLIDISNATGDGWHVITGLNIQLDNSKTMDKIWFIGLFDDASYGGDCAWYNTLDGGITGDGDQTISLTYISGDWDLVVRSSYTIDYLMRVGLVPESNTPTPSQIGLEINNNPILGSSPGSGNVTFSQEYTILPNQLSYEITAEWWDVSCQVTQIQVNYTRSDLKATSYFNCSETDPNVYWIITLGNIDCFDSESGYGNYWINFTIPHHWSNQQAFNSILNVTDDTILGPAIGEYREYQITNAGNSTNWFITSQSQNLMTSFQIFLGPIETYEVNFNETVDFEVSFDRTMSNGNITLEVYSPDDAGNILNHNETQDVSILGADTTFSMTTWDISENATDYGDFRAQVLWNNGTDIGFQERVLTINATTNLILNSQVGLEYFFGEIFNISVYYNDTGQNQPILGGNIESNAPAPLNWWDHNNGTYEIEIDTTILSYGNNYIEIEAWKDNYNNDTIIFWFNEIITTQITPTNTPNLGDIIRGQNATYTFNYSDTDGNPITAASILSEDIPTGFTVYPWSNDGNGNYTILIDTNDVDVSGSPYVCDFSISSEGNETQYINITINVIHAQTQIVNLIFNDVVTEGSTWNQTVTFYYNDILNDRGIEGLKTSNIQVFDNATQDLWYTGDIFNWSLYELGNGDYELNISTIGLTLDWHAFYINISYPPNYNWSVSSVIEFYYAGDDTQINFISVNTQGGLWDSGNYTFFEESDLQLTLNISCYNYVDLIAIQGVPVTFTINATNLISLQEDTLSSSLNPSGNEYTGNIGTSILDLGFYRIDINASLAPYNILSISFNITIYAKYQVRINATSFPSSVTAGNSFDLKILCEYNDGTQWLPLTSTLVSISGLFLNKDNTTTPLAIPQNSTNSNGVVWFQIIIPNQAANMTIQITFAETYNHEPGSYEVPYIRVKSPPDGLNLEDLIPYILLILAAAIMASIGIVGYKKVVVPQKRRRDSVLDEVKTVFDDAVNIEHILVLYKGSGTCIFFKSYGSEKIDPDLISGFISAVSSFGKEVESQKALNEISYEDKMLLLADGQYIRVSLVLSKKASILLRSKLREFIKFFEQRYSAALPNWRGQLNVFKDAGPSIDEIFQTSIILPHQVQLDSSAIKDLRITTSKDILGNAKSISKETGKDYIFISNLLEKTMTKSTKGISKIFMGIKELREKKILIPWDVTALESKAISPQEKQLIEQRICEFVTLPREETQAMIDQLAQMSAQEREVYFASLQEKQEIVSAPIKSKIAGKVVTTNKEASKQVKILVIKARKEKKVLSYKKAIIYYEEAAIIANDWGLKRPLGELQEAIRLTQIDDTMLSKKEFETQAQKELKKKNYKMAAEKFKQAANKASEAFKLGVNSMQDEVKRLIGLSKKFENL